MVGPTTPLVVAYCRPPGPIAVVYLTESAKNASSAVIRFRRSDFIEARYAFSFVFANFGIAIAAKMPMITTTIRNSKSIRLYPSHCTTSRAGLNAAHRTFSGAACCSGVSGGTKCAFDEREKCNPKLERQLRH